MVKVVVNVKLGNVVKVVVQVVMEVVERTRWVCMHRLHWWEVLYCCWQLAREQLHRVLGWEVCRDDGQQSLFGLH